MAGPIKYAFCDACKSRYMGDSCPFCRASATIEQPVGANPGMANNPTDVANSMANRGGDMANKATYRYRDADRRREYMRRYMASRRATKSGR